MVTIAERYHDVFVRAGLRPSFIDDLNDAIVDILATLTGRSERRGARSGATREISESTTKRSSLHSSKAKHGMTGRSSRIGAAFSE